MLDGRTLQVKGMIAEYKNEIQNSTDKNRKIMLESILPSLDALSHKNIDECINFIDTLKSIGFNRIEICKLIFDLISYFNTKNLYVGSIKRRIINKGCNYDRNVILNRLILPNVTVFIEFLKTYPQQKEKPDMFVFMFQKKIEEGKNKVKPQINFTDLYIHDYMDQYDENILDELDESNDEFYKEMI